MAQETLAGIESFQALLPQVREYMRRHIPDRWPDLAGGLRSLADEPLGPLSVLPLASCAAAGGDPHEAVPLAAAWEALNVAIRILDDLQDQDRPGGLWSEIGPVRAFNFSAALYTFSGLLLARAPWPAELYRAISQIFITESLNLAAGQDRDLQGATQTMEDYWLTIQGKNASGFALACAAGARCATDDPELVAACHAFGTHLGLALQIFDDFEGCWQPGTADDLALGRITLPVLYGLSTDGEHREELSRLVFGGQRAKHADRIRTILDKIHAREFLVWSALQERDQALTALAGCPGRAGVAALTAYVTSLFAHMDEILPAQK